MRRCAAVVLLAALLGCAGPPPLTPGAVLSEAVRAQPEQHVVVTVRNLATPPLPNAASTLRGYGGQGAYRAGAQALQAAQRIAATHGLREVAAWPIEVLGVHCLVYALPPAARPGPALAALRSDPDVESAQPLASFTLQASPYNDPYAGLQASLQDLDVPAAQQWSLGQGVRIAVVDTGIDTAHPDFEGRVAAVRDFVGDGQSAAEAHGTAVAGLIAAVPNNGIGIVGIAPQATLLSYRACWSGRPASGACNSFTLAQALAAAVGVRADIVNLSLGGPDDALLRRIVERGQAQGMVFVGAVPPGGRREGFPTSIDGVIAVDRSGRAERQPGVLYAPGAEVFTLTPKGRYDAASGSSIAAAQVAGVAALLRARRPGLGASELQALLARSAPAGAGAQATSVNACAALRQLHAAARCADGGATVAHRP